MSVLRAPIYDTATNLDLISHSPQTLEIASNKFEMPDIRVIDQISLEKRDEAMQQSFAAVTNSSWTTAANDLQNKVAATGW